ncbi:MAG: hypothetical protein JJU29_11235 [Verrucomicrobia bacterium]|nr:hypothetical protein [Verrucomicrobiota bacterium]MCH8512831.1 hypothetical protein [Kiritimatiellia bacterium]
MKRRLLFILVTCTLTFSTRAQTENPEIIRELGEIRKNIEAIEKRLKRSDEIKLIRVNREAEYLYHQVFGREFNPILPISPYRAPVNQLLWRSMQSEDETQTVSTFQMMDQARQARPRDLLIAAAIEMNLRPEPPTPAGTTQSVEMTGTLDDKDVKGTLQITNSTPVNGAAPARSAVLKDYDHVSTRALIESLHKELNNPEWLSNTVRFGMLVNYIDEPDALAAQFSMRMYPAYHRHFDGHIFSLRNFGRRLSGVIAAGPVLTHNSDNFSELNMMYSAGIGIDINHGATFVVSYSVYEGKRDEKDQWEESVSFGISINAEFWDRFRGNMGK